MECNPPARSPSLTAMECNSRWNAIPNGMQFPLREINPKKKRRSVLRALFSRYDESLTRRLARLYG